MNSSNLPQWKCHKVVRAAKIKSVTFGADGFPIITLETGDVVDIPKGGATTPIGTDCYYVVYEDGYTSISPTAPFEAGYARIEAGQALASLDIGGLSFGGAIQWLKAGKRVARKGWNGKGMWLQLQVPDANSKMTLPYVYIEYPADHVAYPSGSRVPWLASQTDMLTDDWMVVE